MTAERLDSGTLIVKMDGKVPKYAIEFVSRKNILETQPIKPAEFDDGIRAEVEKWQKDSKRAATLTIKVEFINTGSPKKLRKAQVAAAPAPQSPTAPPAATNAVRQTAHNTGTTGFHNPYNFIPTPERSDKLDSIGLGDGPPCGHKKWCHDRYTGWIDVTLKTVTPLLIPDEFQSTDHDGHKTLPMRERDGRPLLPTTSVKGMLSSAYEAATNSRMRIFSGHEGRLAQRMDAKQGLSLVPARVENGQIRLLAGSSQIGPGGKPNGNLYAAWLSIDAIRTQPWGSLAVHRNEVWARIESHADRRGRFTAWHVTELVAGTQPQPITAGHWVRGFVFISHKNIDNKHDERVFFHDGAPIPVIADMDDLSHRWRDLITDSQTIHTDEIKKGKHGPPALKRSIWSRHVQGLRERNFDEGTLCYARVEPAGKAYRVIDVFPVNISRELFAAAPRDLLPANLRPALTMSELSPADRVFGWVSADADLSRRKDKETSVAHRGQLRIGQVTCHTEHAIDDTFPPIPLAILSAPKPSQAQFYVADKYGQPVKSKKDGYRPDQQLRGRKIYPHQIDATSSGASTWSNPPPAQSEYRRAGNVTDDQNRSITGWVKPNVEFRFRIHVTNLSQVELGALLWLLSLNDDRPAAARHFRLGYAKPLGFGSVTLAIIDSDLRTGRQLRDDYHDLAIDAPPPDQKAAREQAITAFKAAITTGYGGKGATFETVNFIQAFLKGAEGLSGPVHYPRISPQATTDGENFKWFGKDGPNQPLPLLTDPKPLSYGH